MFYLFQYLESPMNEDSATELPKYYEDYNDLNENHPSFFGNFYDDINIGFGEKFHAPTLPTFNHTEFQIFDTPPNVSTKFSSGITLQDFDLKFFNETFYHFESTSKAYNDSIKSEDRELDEISKCFYYSRLYNF